ncbi:MAG: Crp/Fnr family transcriptional regulator [Bacteroidetes bacterium]|nr:Crp/Fnr family transcriptional regulator [Bacteroidota bacterium]MBT5528178.1 Crp/Fnr family transcriptional regulator [Cytophagia bacterium]MBT3801951.1 Crp/Fnr family transcriptional regulator [Bacteroidota bacterium]MBT3934918.1 Crp/Fnr family transcriptional regulator [Bacteroidota bacterium]MBT4726889.1 Crp/Fnr family transcriptional regulator [Bacteroidota bacterium]
MSENRYTVDYKNGELIYKQGTKSTHVISFVSGLAQVVHSDNGSNSLVLRLIKPPEFITGLGVFFDDFHHYSVSTLKQSRVCFINISVFQELLEENKEFLRAFIGEQNKNHISTLNKLISRNQKNREGRLAENILYLANDIYESQNFKFEFSKQLIADMTGMTRVSVFSVLKSFHKDGLIDLSNGDLKILEPDRLKEISLLG